MPRPPVESSFERTLAVTGPVDLDVATHSGLIRVCGGEPGEVRIRALFRGQRWIFGFSDPTDRMAELTGRPPIELRGNSIRVGDFGDRWLLRGITMLLEISVPRDTRVRALVDAGDVCIAGIAGPVLSSADSGSIEITDIDGDVRASADSGAVRIRRVKGSVDAQADSGSIEALEIGGSINARTDSGEIRLSQSAAAPVSAEADSGSIALQLAPNGGYNVRVNTDSGHVRTPEMAVDSRLSRGETVGRIRGGGPMIHLQTDSGSIEIV
ncbi:MAG TPA: DUF4097 family beta strand repeat-containing protein [Bryobacteraceae bacterium]|nr:DUF4097 family beta strand repeat-containing protein [Bryobacteraceae bacterium]